jgi:hypothetical protein
MANDTIKDILDSVLLGAHTDALLGGVLDNLDEAHEILEAYEVCSPERVYLFRAQDYDNLKARGLHPDFLANLRHWQELMGDHAPPSVELLQANGLYSAETLFFYVSDDYERLERNGVPADTLEKLRRWQQYMIDNPAPFPLETWLEIELADGSTRAVTESVFRIGRSSTNELDVDVTYVSRKHCWLASTRIQDKVAVLTDTSANGTFVNGRKIIEGSDHLLAHGDSVGIGMNGTAMAYTFVVRRPK